MLENSLSLSLALSSSLPLGSLSVVAYPAPPLVTCADLDGPYDCSPSVSAEEWSICCPDEGVWTCCALRIVSGDTYNRRVLGAVGWEIESIEPEWHVIEFQLPLCSECGEGCEWGPIETEDCSPGWRRDRLANPCP